MAKMARLVCLDDYEAYSKRALAKQDHDFINSGAGGEVTLRDNKRAFQRYRLLPRVLRDVSNIDLSTSILGYKVNIPIGSAPMGMQKIGHPDGEVATANAVGDMGSIFTLSTYTSTTMEEMKAKAPETIKFFQMYIPHHNVRETTRYLVKKAEDNGFKAIVLTVDNTVLGVRYKNRRNNFRIASHIKAVILRYLVPDADTNDISEFEKCKSLGWEDVKWLKSLTSLPLVIKGILSPADAAMAADLGVAGVWVSNHGGRQLDTVPATIDVLPSIVRAVAGRCEVYLDGGVRTGTDVLKALALGARAVFVGRPIFHGLTYNGKDGVESVLKILRDELHAAMSLIGCSNVSNLNEEYVIHETEYCSKL